MLQIISGKFFAGNDCHVTRHRAVLYSNYRTQSDVDTAVGSLRVADTLRDIATLIYEVDQRLEKNPAAGFALVAVSPDELVEDFAAVASFAFDVTCTPDLELARRLTQSKHSSLGVAHPPRNYVPRVFDSRVDSRPGDPDRLNQLIGDLIGLERHVYEAVIRAIRRYVTGLHRIGDDLDLAYTLLVASIESLAQDFDAFVPTWMDFPQDKRNRLDTALDEVDAETAARVRVALLKGEHLALARRYQEFAIAHIGPEYFRDEAASRTRPVGRSDLEVGLKRAYQFRSSYIHALRALPKQLTALAWEGESFQVDGRPALTFQGLARVARSVITAFIARAEKVEREAFDWRSALPGILTMEVAPRYWIWRKEGINHKTARRYLRGFLDELATTYVGETEAVTDIRDVLGEVERLAPSLGRKNRLPMLTLYVMYHRILADGHRPNWVQFAERFKADFDAPSVESLVAHALLGEAFPWLLTELDDLWVSYRNQRYHADGFRLPVLFESAVALRIAETARSGGDVHRAREIVAQAVEDFPSNEALRAFERDIGATEIPAIDWRTILLPTGRQAEKETAG